MTFKINSMLFACLVFVAMSCGSTNAGKTSKMQIKEDTVSYTAADGVEMKGYVAYDESISGKRPVIMVVPEWWGLNDYAKSRARQLAELGYMAMAVDMYGGGRTADNPTDAGGLAGPFYKDPAMAKSHFDAALAKAMTYSQSDASKVAAIGYCFGGGMVLNFARLGEDLKGVVSFHGSLKGVPADKQTLKADILVCHGAADKFVPEEEVAAFKHELDSIGASYTFKAYEGATHAFSNPNATAMGQKFSMPIAYNAAADTASWAEMNVFLKKIFK